MNDCTYFLIASFAFYLLEARKIVFGFSKDHRQKLYRRHFNSKQFSDNGKMLAQRP
jgi:hypothetical protein